MQKIVLGATSIFALALSAQVVLAQAPEGGAQGGEGARGGPAEKGAGGAAERVPEPARKSAGGEAREAGGETRAKDKASPERKEAGKGSGERAGEAKTGEAKADDQQKSGEKASETKKSDAAKAADKRTGETETREQRKAGEQRGDETKTETKTGERKAGDDKAGQDKAAEEKTKTGDVRERDEKKTDAAAEGEADRAGTTKEQAARDDVDREEAQRRVQQVKEKVSDRDRDRAREAFRRSNLRRSRDVDVRVDVGVVLPRSVVVYDLPPQIVEVVPAYRGYDYIVVEEEILIVEPETHVVVDVLDYSGQSAATGVGGGEAGSARLSLTEREERFIRDHIDRDRRADIDVEISIGTDFPGTVELYTFPEVVVSEVPKVREYRYVVVDDEDIVIVDPRENDVVYVIGG